MTVLPNPFLHSAVISPRTAGSAVASKPPPAADATAAPIADPDGGYMGHRLSPALGTSVGSAAALSRTSVLDAQTDAAAAPNSALASAMTADTDAAPDLTDPPVAASVLIHSSCGGENAHQSRKRCADNRPAFSEAVEVASGPHEAIPASTGGPQEASAPAPTKNPDADALGTDHIHEIFAGAAKIDDRRFDAEFDQHAFLYAIEEGEELPLFIREDGYLKRQA